MGCITMTKMIGLFSNLHNFDKDISKWNTSKLMCMSQIFKYATRFNSDISKWNTSSITNMNHMFSHA